MAIEFDFVKIADEVVKNAAAAKDAIVKAAGDFGDAAMENASKLADDVARMKDEKGHDLREWWYAPVFPDCDRNSLPKLVVLDDESDRADIDVCRGAIGWIERHHWMQTLHLYHQHADKLGLTFFPKPARGEIYFLDAYSGGRYVEVSGYFDTIQEERIGELMEIAHALGAKHCRIELYEEKKKARILGGNEKKEAKIPVLENGVPVDALDVTAEWKADATWDEEHVLSCAIEQSFSGGEPYEPELHWFAESSVIKSLIKSRVNPQGGSMSKDFCQKIERVGKSTLNVGLAGDVEAAMKSLGVKDNFSLSGEAKKSDRQTFVYALKF